MALLSPIPFSGAERVLFMGDSITAPTRAWHLDFQRRLNAIYLPGTDSAYLARQSGSRSAGTMPSRRAPCFFNSGIGGQVINDLVTNFTAQATQYGPSLVFVLIGINDITIAGTTLGTFTTSLSTLAGLFASNLPGAKVAWISILTAGEVWTSGTPNAWGPNAGGFDATIDSFNTAIKAQATSSGHGYIDARAYWLTLEPTGNPTHAASNYLTVNGDGVHPTDGTAGLYGAGKVAITDAVMAACSFAA